MIFDDENTMPEEGQDEQAPQAPEEGASEMGAPEAPQAPEENQ